MKSICEKSLVLGLAVMILSLVSLKTYAASAPYNTSSLVDLVTIYNDTSSNRTLAVNTRPTVGTGGVIVYITKSDGTVLASKTFPYQVSVPDLEETVPSGVIRHIVLGPNSSGQNVQGTLTYNRY